MATQQQQTLTPVETPQLGTQFWSIADPKASEVATSALLPTLGEQFHMQVDERQANVQVFPQADNQGTADSGNVAHIYQPERGNPGWGKTQAWGLAGYDPSISVYDVNFGDSENDFHSMVTNGFKRLFSRLPLSAPTMTRNGRVAMQHDTLPAARFFQSYTGAGTGQNWSGAQFAQGQRSLRTGWNPNMQGAAELHPATVYDPFPSPASLYPKVV